MTSLPIDYARRPWKEKYLTSETPVLNRWFLFGVYPDGSVGIAGPDDDIFKHVPPDVAQRIIAARDAFCDVVEAELGFPKP